MIQKVIVVVIQKLKIDVFQNPVIPPLNIYPNGVSSFYREICSVTFIAVLFIEAGNWRQPICLSVNEKMKKLLYIYKLEYYSIINTDGNHEIHC